MKRRVPSSDLFRFCRFLGVWMRWMSVINQPTASRTRLLLIVFIKRLQMHWTFLLSSSLPQIWPHRSKRAAKRRDNLLSWYFYISQPSSTNVWACWGLFVGIFSFAIRIWITEVDVFVRQDLWKSRFTGYTGACSTMRVSTILDDNSTGQKACGRPSEVCEVICISCSPQKFLFDLTTLTSVETKSQKVPKLTLLTWVINFCIAL